MNLGLDRNRGKVFEGCSSNYGRELTPPPLISRCQLVTDKSQLAAGAHYAHESDGYIFREDYFDPKSRVRRGRFYKPLDSLTQQWKNERDPQFKLGEHSTYTYHPAPIWAHFHREGHREVYVLLGDQCRFTVWKLVDMEVMFTGEELHTLKALSTFGLLPELLEAEIPSEHLPLIREKLGHVADEAHTASAESIVDHCREAASAIIGAYLGQDKDLGHMLNALSDKPNERRMAASAAAIINIFHPRRKAAEQKARGLRRITDEDGQLAVACLGNILVELEWGRW